MTSTPVAPAPDDTGGAERATAHPLGLDLAVLRGTVDGGVTHDLGWRRTQLSALRQLISEHEAALAEAITADVGKPPLEVRQTETSASVQEIDHLLGHLHTWTRPRRVGPPSRPYSSVRWAWASARAMACSGQASASASSLA